MATTVTASETTTSTPLTGHEHIVANLRPARQASRQAVIALMTRDLTVLWKNKIEVAIRTIVQPFLLVFVFLYVFPTIGQGIGSGQGSAGESQFATILVAGVVGVTIMMQGIQSVAMPLSAEFGFTREIEDRVQAPCPVSLVALAKVFSGAIQGVLAALIVFPIAAVVHAKDVHVHLSVHWLPLLTIIPLACILFSALGLFLGTKFEPRNIGLMFGFIVLPITFLGGVYYAWTTLAPVKVGGFHWLQTVVLINPLIYVTEGMRAALTKSAHMHLYIVYPVLIGACAFFLYLGLKGFRKRVLS